MKVSDEQLQEAMAVQQTAELSAVVATNIVTTLVEASWQRGELPATEHALLLASQLLADHRYSTIDDQVKPYLHYTVANAWANKEHLAAESGHRQWDWQAEFHEKQIFHLRTALSECSETTPDQLKAQILTNLANVLDRVGRFIEALEYYDDALSLAPDYGMPRGNRGIALDCYARSVPDPGHGYFLLYHAAQDLQRALTNEVDEHAAHDEMRRVLERALSYLGKYTLPDGKHSLGNSDEERAYRSWALEHRLFLNPLNDLGALPIAAHDPLTPLSIVTDAGAGPYLFGFFNTMKQEYVAARYFLYQGLHTRGSHFADKDVKITDTFDYAVHELAVEQVKIAFRQMYSLFDKVAFFVNDYFQLGIPFRQIYFRSLWFETPRCQELRSEFAKRPNWPLRGLFWMSKDLFEKRDDHASVLEPDARKLADVRQALEHRHLKITESEVSSPATSLQDDPLAVLISRSDLEAKALRIARAARNALVQLVCAVAAEEREKASKRGSAAGLMFMPDRDRSGRDE